MKVRLGSILGSGAAGACLLAILFSSGCGGENGGEAGTPAADDPSGDGHTHEVGLHGGEVLVLGTGEVHVEFTHDDQQGRIDLYLTGADCTTAMEVADAPAVNLKTAEGPRQLATRPAGGSAPASHFEVTDPLLADHHLDGQLVIQALGKQYFAAMPDHEHEGVVPHTHAENAISFTAWTESCEWFVELETPEAGQPAEFAAHVTLLDTFKPVTAGSFRVDGNGGGEKSSSQADAPARPGIYTPSITLPAAGAWTLSLAYEGSGISETVDWQITVHEPGQVPPPAEDPAGVISFLKEQQWKVQFATAAVEAGDVLTVPAGAILADAGELVVFVQLGGEAFERRVVEVGADTDGSVEILSGLSAGEHLVTTGVKAVLSAGG